MFWSRLDILLDLHHLLVNERNGRQPVDGVLAGLPLERVLEVHLAGGFAARFSDEPPFIDPAWACCAGCPIRPV